MRHGNPPKFDAEPSMKLKEIATLLVMSPQAVRFKLQQYYADYGIERKKKNLAIKLNDDEMQTMLEMRHGDPPKFDAVPLMKLREIAQALDLSGN